jgi:sugar/nucleoside kinase (ribokinase family)
VQVVAAARSLVAAGASRVLVTLSERGAVLVGPGGSVLQQPALPVPGGTVVDGTAAGVFTQELTQAFSSSAAVVLDGTAAGGWGWLRVCEPPWLHQVRAAARVLIGRPGWRLKVLAL